MHEDQVLAGFFLRRLTYRTLGEREGRKEGNDGKRLHGWLYTVGGKEWTSSLVSTTTGRCMHVAKEGKRSDRVEPGGRP